MGAARYVGRVGGLAVALGIGAIGTFGVGQAWADPTDSTDSGAGRPSASHSAAPARIHSGPVVRARGGRAGNPTVADPEQQPAQQDPADSTATAEIEAPAVAGNQSRTLPDTDTTNNTSAFSPEPAANRTVPLPRITDPAPTVAVTVGADTGGVDQRNSAAPAGPPTFAAAAVTEPAASSTATVTATEVPPVRHRQVVDLVWCCQDWSVGIAARYKGYRYPIEVVGHAVWLYHRFALSLRDVEELMLARGVVVSYETIRSWCARFGPDYANKLRRRRSRPGDKWHLDEVFVKINGITHYLWRAVDQHGDVLDILVQSRRNAAAAKRFFRQLLKGQQYVPRVIVTDKLASYGAAHRELLPSVTHRRSKYLNNRAENSHQPTRIRERVMKRFASPGQAQRFLFAFSHIRGYFRPRRHLISAPQWRAEMTARFAVWDEITTAATA